MAFPETRLRRLRRTATLRRMVRETRLAPEDFILPLFVRPGTGVANPVGSMPGVFQHSIDRMVEAAAEAWEAGVPAVLLFGLPDHKDAIGSAAWDDDGIVQQAARALSEQLPDLVTIADLCFCEYTDHGHCGVLAPDESGTVDNDATLENLGKQAVSLARAGIDVIAPSDMMDGRVGAVRDALDAERFENVAVLSYAAKFASAFYGPFREAAESAPSFGDRKTYQMDAGNRREALREVELDVLEGADMVMVKPAVPYLDVLSDVAEAFGLPTAAYHVSGEYAMIRAAAERGWIDGERVLMETLLAIRRAGADMIVTYGALDAARLLERGWEP
jgi:porphobilinogen synthase